MGRAAPLLSSSSADRLASHHEHLPRAARPVQSRADAPALGRAGPGEQRLRAHHRWHALLRRGEIGVPQPAGRVWDLLWEMGAASHRACRSHAQVRGKQGSLRGWCRGRAEPDGAQKAPRKAMARALCSSAAPHSLHKPAKPKVPLVWYEAQSRNWGGDCPFRLSL